jgi:hypothetical protein
MTSIYHGEYFDRGFKYPVSYLTWGFCTINTYLQESSLESYARREIPVSSQRVRYVTYSTHRSSQDIDILGPISLFRLLLSQILPYNISMKM